MKFNTHSKWLAIKEIAYAIIFVLFWVYVGVCVFGYTSLLFFGETPW